MSDYFSRLTINGMPAEDVMLKAVDAADKCGNVKIAVINREEERLMNMRANADSSEKSKIDEVMRRLSDYKLSLQNKIGEL